MTNNNEVAVIARGM